MPGPRNAKRKKQMQIQKEKRYKSPRTSLDVAAALEHERAYRPLPSQPLRYTAYLPSTPAKTLQTPNDAQSTRDVSTGVPQTPCNQRPPNLTSPSLPKRPCIEDNGDGFRVRDVVDFIESRFASPPSLEDPLCAEFSQEEVLDMLCTVLPEETATVLLRPSVMMHFAD